MMILTYDDALAAIGKKSADMQFPDCDMTIKPTDNLRATIPDSAVEGAILSRQSYIHFE